MSESYEIIGKEIQYTNSEYPGFSIKIRKYRSEEISKKRVKQKWVHGFTLVVLGHKILLKYYKPRFSVSPLKQTF